VPVPCLLADVGGAENLRPMLGALLTIVYMISLVFRPQRQWLRMGPDSIAVLILYAIGITGLMFISG
jgi:cation:H+ antiporter